MPTTPSNEREFKKLQRNPHYYLNGGDVHFLVHAFVIRTVGNQLFRVHRFFFERESAVFLKQIDAPTAPGRPRQGEDDSVALVLDVAPLNFEKFLGVFYNPRYSLYDWSSDDWTCILELAVKWEFPEVKNLAVRELEKQEDMSVITRIALYQKFQVDHALLVPLYGTLCSRPDALDDDESRLIGRKTTVLVFRARERLRAQSSDGGKSPLPAGLEREDVERTILTLLPNRSTPDSLPNKRTIGEESITDASAKDKEGDSGRNSPVILNANGRTGRAVKPNKL
ncbi:hypothetical protein DXG03_006228 [Asterophora parasitica]|uniref:BTB domain-containing protein n=1 Tax=Asterophora parasitica TaxID=117018 RepID=A0A9P7KDK6_9AGAR|nr:hypothetical protein DXG03_006228 [Asterophora parasitica]